MLAFTGALPSPGIFSATLGSSDSPARPMSAHDVRGAQSRPNTLEMGGKFPQLRPRRRRARRRTHSCQNVQWRDVCLAPDYCLFPPSTPKLCNRRRRTTMFYASRQSRLHRHLEPAPYQRLTRHLEEARHGAEIIEIVLRGGPSGTLKIAPTSSCPRRKRRLMQEEIWPSGAYLQNHR